MATEQKYSPVQRVNIGPGKDDVNDFARKYNLEIENIYDLLNKYTVSKVVFYGTSSFWSSITGGYRLSLPHNGNIVFAVYKTISTTESQQVLVGVSMNATNVMLDSVTKFDGYMLYAAINEELGIQPVDPAVDANAAAIAARDYASSASTTATQLMNWLESKETLTAPAVDPTLTISGAAADAKATGDMLLPVFDRVQTLDMLLTQQGNIAANGGENSSTTHRRSGYIKVSQGTVYNWKLQSPTGAPCIAFYTSPSVSGYVSANSVLGTYTLQNGTYTVPADGYIRLVCFTAKIDQAYFYSNANVKKELMDLNTKIDENVTRIDNNISVLHPNGTPTTTEVYKKVFGLLAADKTNAFINGSGNLVTNAIYRTTQYIPISAGETFTYKIAHGTTLPIIAFYSTTDTASYVSANSVIGVAGYTSGTYTAPADGFLRFVYHTSYTDSIVIFTDEMPDNVKKNIKKNYVSDLNILCMGDSIFGNDGEIVANLATFTGANVINGAFGGSRVSNRGGTDQFQYFDGINLVHALVTNNWTNQDNAATALESSYPWLRTRLATLKSVDLSTLDVITFDWGTNDYAAGALIGDITSAYTSVIDDIQQYYPHIRILIITPIWRYFGSKSENRNGDNYVVNVSTLKEIASAIDSHAQDMHIEVLQMYQKMPLSYNTADLYFDSGSDVHLNTTGNMVYAHILNGKIQSMY